MSTCASPASKLSSVGTLLIMYVRPRPAVMTSGASYSISAYVTPPSASPTPASIRDLTSGETWWQVVHQEVVHRVSKGRREVDERER